MLVACLSDSLLKHNKFGILVPDKGGIVFVGSAGLK
jgi:hypothetical protein